MAFLPGRLTGAFVAGDCIALNYLGKHKQEIAIRSINKQESNQQQ